MPPPRKPPPRNPSGAEESPLTELDGVRPVRGPKRVALVGSRVARVAPASSRPSPPSFVFEHGEDRVVAYREGSSPHALKTVLDARFVPQATVDLHRRRVAGLSEELAMCVRREVARGVRRLLVVHGRGRHSTGGIGILRDAVIEALTEGPAAMLVDAMATAPPRLGGEGALVVSLVSRRRG